MNSPILDLHGIFHLPMNHFYFENISEEDKMKEIKVLLFSLLLAAAAFSVG